MLGYVVLEEKNLFLFYKENSDTPIVTLEDILKSDGQYEDVIREHNLKVIEYGNNVVLEVGNTSQGANFTNIYVAIYKGILAGKIPGVETKLKNAIDGKGYPYTYLDMVKASDNFTIASKRDKYDFVVSSNELLNNSIAEGEERAKLFKRLRGISVGNDVQENSSNKIMSSPLDSLNLRVPDVYELWQIFSVTTLAERDRTISSEDLDVYLTDDIDEDSIGYNVTYENVDCNIPLNIGVFNRRLDSRIVRALADTNWMSSTAIDKTCITGTKDNSLLPIQLNEKQAYEDLKKLAENCLVWENYTEEMAEKYGKINLRKSPRARAVVNRDKESGISIEEAKQYVNVEELVAEGKKSTLFQNYVIWLVDLALCATRAHLGFLDAPEGYSVDLSDCLYEAIYGTKPVSKKKNDEEDEEDIVGSFNFDDTCRRRNEHINYRPNIMRYILGLKGSYSAIDCIIKLLRWNERKVQYLQGPNTPYSISLEDFKIVCLEGSLDESKVKVLEGGYNRVLVSYISSERNFDDRGYTTQYGLDFTDCIVGFVLRKSYEGSEVYVDNYVDLPTLVDEYKINKNKNFKVYGIDFDDSQDKFIVDSEICDGTKDLLSEGNVPLDTACGEGGVITKVHNKTIIDMIVYEDVEKGVNYNHNNLFTALREISYTDNILLKYKLFKKSKKDFRSTLAGASSWTVSKMYMNYVIAFKYLTMFNYIGKIHATTSEGLEKVLNAIKDIKISAYDSVPKTTEGASGSTGGGFNKFVVNKVGQTQAQGTEGTASIASKTVETIHNAFKIVDKGGNLVAYAVKGVKGVNPYIMKFYGVDDVEVGSLANAGNTQGGTLLKSLSDKLKVAAKGNRPLYFKAWAVKINFSSESIEETMKALYDWTVF